MDLKCLLDHMKGESVLVNGTRYPIDDRGILHDAKDDDAKKLLSMVKTWVTASPEKTPVQKKDVDVTLPSMEPMVMAAEMRKQADTPPPPPKEDLAEVVAKDEEAEVEIQEEEWPDPEESMEIDYLRQMADAYEVKYDGRLTKKTLVKRIRAAMYE